MLHNHEIYIPALSKLEERQYRHSFAKDQVEHVLKSLDMVIAGTATLKVRTLGSDAEAF